jgi:hypothetical protein
VHQLKEGQKVRLLSESMNLRAAPSTNTPDASAEASRRKI